MTTDTETRISQRKGPPVLSQWDLRYIRGAADRTSRGLRLAASWGRHLSGAEVQLLMACSAVCEIITGQLGEEVEDGMLEPVGDLVLRQAPSLPLCHQPRLEGNGK